MKSKRWMLVITAMLFLTIVFNILIGSAGAQSSGGENKIYIPVVYRQPTPTPPVSNGPPPPSISYYFDVFNPANLNSVAFNLGCNLGSQDLSLAGKQDRVVILDFGTPKLVEGKLGASLMYRNGFGSMAQIRDAAIKFGYGYWYCVGADFESHLRIGIGTNNYAGSSNPAVTYAHGQAWAQVVNQVNDWFINSCSRNCDGQVDAVGANDIELGIGSGWAGPNPTIDWLNGYDSVNLYPLYNYGALPGCPYFASPGANCGTGGYIWTKEQVWRVTDSGPVQSMPEIYLNSGVNAQQWYLMSVWAYQNKGKPLDFIGTMTQYGACQQVSDSSCPVMDNTPQEGWTQLNNLVNGDVRTRWPILYSTDIRWLGE